MQLYATNYGLDVSISNFPRVHPVHIRTRASIFDSPTIRVLCPNFGILGLQTL